MTDRLKVIYRARNGPEAHLLKNALEEAGIKAVITNTVLEGGSGVDILGFPTLPRVAVAAEDAEVARRMALEFERSIRGESAAQDEPSEEPQQADIGSWWPRCPGCGAPRLMLCPYCGTSGTGFRLADQPEGETPAGAGQLVVCGTCDEPMTPQYLRECEWCGHRFDDGAAPPQGDLRSEWSWRVTAAVIALAAVVVGLIAYFAWLL